MTPPSSSGDLHILILLTFTSVQDSKTKRDHVELQEGPKCSGIPRIWEKIGNAGMRTPNLDVEAEMGTAKLETATKNEHRMV